MQKCQQNYSIIILLQNWYSYSLFMFVGAFLMLIHILNTFIRNLTLQQRQMGITDTKTISLSIDSEFKSIRKYHDHLYGEITLVQQKSTGKMFALVEKVILSADKSLAQFLTLRKQFSPYLVKLHDFYHCSVDYCSGLEKYFFLLEYSSHTLYRQMAQRQQLDNKFTLEELFDTFNSYLQMMSFLRDKSQLFKSFISNHYILYSSPKQMKTVEILFKIEKDQFQNDFHLIKNYQGSKQLYLAPEAFQLLCNREKLKAKYVSLREEAIVFMLGMNFIECALLADISGVYGYFGKSISFDRLMKAVQQVNFFYGQETSQMIFQMVSLNPADRPSIQSIKDFVKLNLKRRKIVIPKHSKVQQSKQKQLRV